LVIHFNSIKNRKEGISSTQEIEQALAKKFTPITLGKSRLRTETAGITAVQTAAFINELGSI